MARDGDFGAMLKAVAAGAPRPLYVIIGEDDGLRAQALEAVRRAVLGAKDAESALVTFGPPDPAAPSSALDLARIMDEVRTASLFAPKKLVLVRGADALLAAAGGGKPAPLQEPLSAYLAAPVPGNTLVLETEKLDMRTALAKELEKSGSLVVCPRLYAALFGETEVSLASSLGRYLVQSARERGLILAPDAGRRLLELADGGAGKINAELDKLAEYLGGDKRPVALADVDALVARGAADADGVVLGTLSGDAAGALTAAEEVFARGLTDFTGRLVWDEGGIALILVGSLRRRAFEAERTALAGGRYASKGKPPPAHVTKAVEAAARRWRGAALERTYRRLLEAESELKGSSARSGREIVEDLVLALCGGAGAGKAPARSRQ